MSSSISLPGWGALEPAEIVSNLRSMLAAHRQAVASLVAMEQAATWDNFIQPLAELEDELERFWSPVSHMHGVNNNDEWRAVYDEALPLLTEYSTEMGQNVDLYRRIQALAEASAFAGLDRASQQAIENRLRDFRLAGVALEGEQRTRFAELRQDLSRLSTAFSNNVLDATAGWHYLAESESELAGVPRQVLDGLARAAQSRGLDGFLITLDIPSYLPVMQSCQNRELRQTLYHAYVTRASAEGPGGGRWDNSEIMQQILQSRHELAQLLGFSNYAELSLAPKMADSPGQVIDFLQNLAQHSVPAARREIAELGEFAAAELALPELQAWDVAYAAEQLRQQRYQLSQQELRPWFPVNTVIKGLFSIAGRLFGVGFESHQSENYHADVQCYYVLRDGQPIAAFLFDLFAREGKRGGAWMADCASRRRLADGAVQLPVAFLTCNFTPLDDQGQSLLTHDEVTTLFHEFGHGLHHMLTQVDVASVAGINGVEWDAVELPSQFMENWCWEQQGLALISGHVDSAEPLPDDKLACLLAARNFHSAMQMVRQLEFALFDMRIHQGADVDIQASLDKVRKEVAVVPTPSYNRFQHGFSHIFAGGYAAGYYSYKWAEVLSADAFSLFEEKGVFDQHTGEKFQREILATGGSRDAMENFVAFRGREPRIEALLRHSGLQEAS